MSTKTEPEAKPGRKKAKRKVPPRMPEALWIELRVLYESGTYSQKALADWAKAKGFSITQPAISMRVVREGWVKGDIREKMTEEIRKNLEGGIVDKIRKMLETHAGQGQIGQMEIMLHFKQAAENRKSNPDFKIPAAQVATLLQALKMAEDMEARARGWSYKEGKPFRLDDDDESQDLPELTVRVLTDEEEAAMRERAEDDTADVFEKD
jgi:hypothetical protein